MRPLLLAFAFLVHAASAQSDTDAPAAHAIPFATADHTIELALGGEGGASGLRVEVVEAPAWVAFEAPSVRAVALGAGEPVARLRFGLTREAPVGQPGTVRLVAVDAAGAVLGTHEVRIEAAAPETFAVALPRPNPVAVTARVPYELPAEARVEASVYDLLGRRVLQLVDETQAAGGHELAIDARALAAGVYVVRLAAELGAGAQAELRRITVVR